MIEKLPQTVPIFLSVRGGFRNLLGLVRQEMDFDFLSGPDATGEDLDVSNIVPLRAVADAFDFHIGPSSKYLPIKHAAQGAVCLIGTPTPKRRDAYIIEKFAKANKPNYRGQNVMEIGLNTPQLRLKFWVLECKRSMKWAKEQGMEYLAAPVKSLHSSSFLGETYYLEATHTIMEYGALVLEQVLEIARKYQRNMAHG